jgi:hypothetical protein
MMEKMRFKYLDDENLQKKAPKEEATKDVRQSWLPQPNEYRE